MLTSALVYLLAAVISVPIAKKLGFGSVLGYLIAGMIIGPYALHLVGDQTDVMHFAEFGVVLMLFLIGLELRPRRLWQMRRPILGLGGMQVLLSALAITFIVLLLTDTEWRPAVAIGLALALSSTAIVLQSLTERGLLKTPTGNNVLAVLLFQDIAVIPILALLPLLSSGGSVLENDHASLIQDLPQWAQVLVSVGIIGAIVVSGRFLFAPIFRIIAETRLRELFTALSLLIVIAIAALMQTIGLSPALGTFLAGVVLADNEFRHELETDIEPFKGLLLGLFFITVGASIDFELLINEPVFIGSAVLLLFISKAAILFALAKSFKMVNRQAVLFTVSLAQGGEFAFVIVSTARQFSVFKDQTGDLLILVVALSMLISPLLIVLYDKVLSRKSQKASDQDADHIDESAEVIIAGYGRFGQIIGRLLTAQGYNLTILDHSPGQVEMVRRFGNTVYFGDASRRDLLAAAGAGEAKLLVIAVDDAVKTLEIIEMSKKHFPHLKILARAIDRRHAYELMRLGIQGFRRETFDSALELGIDALEQMGVARNRANEAGRLFKDHDEQSMVMLAELWGDEKSYGVAMKQRVIDLQQVLMADQQRSSATEVKEKDEP